METELDRLRIALNLAARQGCWCLSSSRLCVEHDRFDDGVVAVMEALTDTGWSCHHAPNSRPDLPRFMRFHDKNSVHMDGCRRLYVLAAPVILEDDSPSGRG